jgi:teichuronic acid biosynthesis glycosyltransferase TuaG
MTGARPLVSVLTPTYEAAAFVSETVESVLAQTYEPVEHVLVDDGSTDRTPELLAELTRAHAGRIRVVRFPERAGPCRRRNDALAAARGSLIAWLDHDDVWLPTKLERQLEALSAAPAAVLSFTQYEEFDDGTGAILSRSALHDEGDLLQRLFVEGCFIASSTVVFRRAALARRDLRFRDREFSFGDDYWLWLGLLLDGDAVLVDEPLVRLRRHGANESARLGRENFHLRRIALLREFLDEFPEAAERFGSACRSGLARHYVAAAGYELERGRRLRAARAAARAAVLDPAGASRFALRAARRAPRRLLPQG